VPVADNEGPISSMLSPGFLDAEDDVAGNDAGRFDKGPFLPPESLSPPRRRVVRGAESYNPSAS